MSTNKKVQLTSAMDWIVSSKSLYVEALTTSTSDYDLIWNRVIAAVIG